MAMLSSLVGSSKIKSCDLDPVPAHVLKEWLSVLLPAMTKIVNLSIKSALVTNCFKLALLNPLLEKPRVGFNQSIPRALSPYPPPDKPRALDIYTCPHSQAFHGKAKPRRSRYIHFPRVVIKSPLKVCYELSIC